MTTIYKLLASGPGNQDTSSRKQEMTRGAQQEETSGEPGKEINFSIRVSVAGNRMSGSQERYMSERSTSNYTKDMSAI